MIVHKGFLPKKRPYGGKTSQHGGRRSKKKFKIPYLKYLFTWQLFQGGWVGQIVISFFLSKYVFFFYALTHANLQRNFFLVWGVRCVVRYIIAKIQSWTAIFFFPGGQESSIYSPCVPRISLIARLLNVRFRLLLHLAAVSWTIC